jgi:alkylation response protein AidB-like acyl-CoA dehydrogenase
MRTAGRPGIEGPELSGTDTTHFARTLFDEEHEALAESYERFIRKEAVPNREQWERDGIMPREFYTRAGAHGFLGLAVPEEYGGPGVTDFRFNVVINEVTSRLGLAGLTAGIQLHNDVCLPYFLNYCTTEQRERWLPGLVTGELLSAIAMTEPGTGSDLAGIATTAIRQGDHYVVNGSKTFITSGINSDVIVTAVRTDPADARGISLLVVERDTPGFSRGRNLDKIGWHAQDTAELFFHEARVPAANLLGQEGQGLRYMAANLHQERLAIAVSAVAVSEAALQWTLDYVKGRKAFGRPIGSFQHSRFVLAEMRTEVEIARIFIDHCVHALNQKRLTAEQGAMAKWWTTELQGRVVDACLQLHGGYGYMSEYPIARAYADARVTRIFGGTNEIMKEIIGKAEGLR